VTGSERPGTAGLTGSWHTVWCIESWAPQRSRKCLAAATVQFNASTGPTGNQVVPPLAMTQRRWHRRLASVSPGKHSRACSEPQAAPTVNPIEAAGPW